MPERFVGQFSVLFDANSLNPILTAGGEFITGEKAVYGKPVESVRDEGITITPKKGRLTFFNGMSPPHGLNKVIGNTRHTAIFWWTNTKFY